MLLPKNKKALFLLAFIVIYAVILAGLLYIVMTEAADKKDLIGLRAANLIRTNQESEKIQMYLDLSAKYSSSTTLDKLGNNGGYS